MLVTLAGGSTPSADEEPALEEARIVNAILTSVEEATVRCTDVAKNGVIRDETVTSSSYGPNGKRFVKFTPATKTEGAVTETCDFFGPLKPLSPQTAPTTYNGAFFLQTGLEYTRERAQKGRKGGKGSQRKEMYARAGATISLLEMASDDGDKKIRADVGMSFAAGTGTLPDLLELKVSKTQSVAELEEEQSQARQNPAQAFDLKQILQMQKFLNGNDLARKKFRAGDAAIAQGHLVNVMEESAELSEVLLARMKLLEP